MGKFNVQCSLPPDVTTFVSSPDARGTLDIVWSCLGIMLICTWSILHPNVPFQTIPRRKKHKYTRAIFRIRKKLIWMLFNILAPEWSLGKAWADYQAVRTVEAEFDALKDETQDDVEWTRTHTYLANMGGITILFDDSMISQERDRWILDASQLLLARRYGIIDRLPDMREDDISDRNKGDLFVKAIAIGQTLWFVLQLIVRITWRLPTSQLEIMTLAFALCTAMAYLLLLDKPKDVQYSVVIHAKRYATPKQLIRLALLGPTTYGLYRGGINIPNNAIHVVRTRSGAAFHWPLFVGASFSIFIFGALHCVAWEFAFPNKIEQWLWQASSVVTAASIPCAWVFRRVAKIIRQNLLGNKKSAMYFRSPASILSGNIIAATFGLLFILSRVIILVEVFRSLAFLPPRAFETTWVNAIPHFG
ncbi:hypothetical protein GQ53DRAFT_884500 [Thozetella sp. PMI_491]|nr:hypothetical protein GQ53DRAFT_884500 [Thozetella sp. PMI_491]